MNVAQERPRVWMDVSALMALCAGLRLLFVRLVPRVLDSPDAVAYLETARLIGQGDVLGVDPKIPILYPALVALAHWVIPDLESAGRAVSWVFSTLLVAPVYLLARLLHGRASARIAGLLIVFWPWLIDYGSRVATEPAAVFLWMCGVCGLTRCVAPGARPVESFVAGLCFSLLHFTRPEGTFIYLGALLALIAFGFRGRERPALHVAAFIVPGAIAAGIGLLYTHALTGEWTVNYRAGFIGDSPEGSSVARDLARTLVAFSADVPAVMLGPLLWAFLGVGVVAAGGAPRDTRRELLVAYFAAMQWLVVIPVLSPAPRYLMSTFVALSIWSARGVERTGAIAGGTSRVFAQTPLAIVIAWMVFHSGAQIASERLDADRSSQPWEYKTAGEWMREHLEPGLIMTRKPQVGFYANMPSAGPPADADLDTIRALARDGGFRYLVVDERYTAGLVPALGPLLEPEAAPDWLRIVNARLSTFPHARVVVYEFVDFDGNPSN